MRTPPPSARPLGLLPIVAIALALLVQAARAQPDPPHDPDLTSGIDQPVHMRWVHVPPCDGRPEVWALLVRGRSLDVGGTNQGEKLIRGVILPLPQELGNAGDLYLDAVRYTPTNNVGPFNVLELRAGMAYMRLSKLPTAPSAAQDGELARALAQRAGSYDKLASLTSILTPEDDAEELQERFAVRLPLDTEADYEELFALAMAELEDPQENINNPRALAMAEEGAARRLQDLLYEQDIAAQMAWHFWPLIITHSTVSGASGTDVFTVALPERNNTREAISVLAKGERHWVSYHADNQGNVVQRAEEVSGHMQYRRLATRANANSPVGRVASVVAKGDLPDDAQNDPKLREVEIWLEHARCVLKWADNNQQWPD